MTTWQIFSDAENNFRWEISVGSLVTIPEEPRRVLIRRDNPDSRLPSMGDLLFQGSSKLLQNSIGGNECPPMFRTGLGKSVAVKQSSIMKALSILGEEDVEDSGEVRATDGGCSFSNSLFQTGSGKMVNISSAGILKAKTLLGLEENYNRSTSQRLEHTRKQPATDELYVLGNLPHIEKRSGVHNNGTLDARSVPIHLVNCQANIYPSGSESKKHTVSNLLQPETCKSACQPPPIKFQTAGGRSISVSSDALQRARSLLGDTELGTLSNEGIADDPPFSFFKEKRFDETSLNNENDPYASCFQQNAAVGAHTSKRFHPPMGLFSNQKQSFAVLEAINSESKLSKQVDSNNFICQDISRTVDNISCMKKPSRNEHSVPCMEVKNSLAKDIDSRMTPLVRSSGKPLVDISNNISPTYSNRKHIPSEKKRLGRRSSISPFKRPRSSRFTTPLSSTISLLPNGLATLTKSEGTCCKAKVSTRYPFQVERMTLREFFGGPPCHHKLLEHMPDKVKCMDAESAEKYMFRDESGSDVIGVEAFHHMLSQSKASMLNASKEWVANHFKWIIWKLACYERGYPAKAMGKYLTVSNVLEELKYRYEREVNHGHRSAIKRILEGDASPASMVVLCIAAVRSYPDPNLGTPCPLASYEDAKKLSGSKQIENSNVGIVELTDGWYSLDALLDVPLSKQLLSGKLFVGLKLRIWGAGLCGWVGPVSPLEASKTVRLQLHINGTYRACWADRLGFCKGLGAPLAFRCIKSAGGLVPRTLVGVTRIYPVLYKERLSTGGSVVRSEKEEAKMLQLYSQRCSIIAEGIISEFQKDIYCSHSKNDHDSDEGAKIFKILETAAEPEVLMADMSSEQLAYFATYQAKQEAIRQSDMQKKIEKALEDAGLRAREVIPFMRVRVVGLISKLSQRKDCIREGLITIWNPTEQQRLELVEGRAYAIAGLIPLNSDSDIIYLHARGSTTTWNPLPASAVESFEPFFTPRKSILLSNLGEVPLASEFDIAAVVVYVGEVYKSGHQKKQWVFVTDDSTAGSELLSEGSSNCLLAVSFCSPVTENDSSAPVNYNLVGSTVGFCNLLKRARDKMNHLWVAEATENSTYSFSNDLLGCSHLKHAADSAFKWATISSSTIQKLRERILFIIGGCES